VTPEELHAPLERALREGHLIPVVFASAKTGTRIAELMNIIVQLLPNPLEGNPPVYVKTAADGKTSELGAEPDPKQHALAHVFKIEIDPYIGRLAVFRVHQGRLTPGGQLYIGEGRKPIKAGHLFLLRGKTQLEVNEALPGDICAIAKIDEIQFDHVLHDSAEDAQVHARPLELPTSVFGLAVLPKKRGDEQKVSDVLHKIIAEDPCFRIEHNAQANETLRRGLGEMHLRTVLEKMSSQYKLDLDTRPPSIPYRETIAVRAEGHSRHKKQTGGAGQFGEVFLKVEPLPRGSGFEFVDSVKGGAIPNQFIPSVEKGVRSVLDTGYIAGFPLQDVRVIVYDGKSHPVDSKDVAFMSAGRRRRRCSRSSSPRTGRQPPRTEPRRALLQPRPRRAAARVGARLYLRSHRLAVSGESLPNPAAGRGVRPARARQHARRAGGLHHLALRRRRRRPAREA